MTGLVLFGCASPSLPAPAQSATELSGLFSVGSRKMYLECHGSGSPTVILESGFGDAGDIWNYTETDPTTVWAGTAAFTRVCSYDRPGTVRSLDDGGTLADTPLPSRSDPAPMPRVGADVVADLHELLEVAKVPGPYILVGHSLGGLLSILHARTHPEQVAGLVLVDATVPTLRQVLPAREWQDWAKDIETPRTQERTLIPDFVSETYDTAKTFDQVDTASPFSRRPVVLLAAAGYERPYEDFVVRTREANALFAKSVPGVQVTTVPKTTHYIQVQRPDAVIEAIRSMV